MSTTNEKKDMFLSAQTSVSEERNQYLEKLARSNDNTELAIIHLKNNINWYRHKYSDYNSSKRNSLILNEISRKFKNVNLVKLKSAISRKGILTNFQFLTSLITLMIFTFSFSVYSLINSDYSSDARVFISFLSFMAHIIITVVVGVMYDESHRIKLYRTNLLKDKQQ